ncbi:MAG: nicotinate phosphoribosyltransferase [Candidatus Njordarchaeota archaeon]
MRKSERIFLLPFHDEIKNARITDIYFIRTKQILEKDNIDKVVVAAEFTVSSMPKEYEWFVFAGLREILKLLEGLPIDVYAVPEGTILTQRDIDRVRVPVMLIVGPYAKFAVYETSILGIMAAASGFATKASRLKKLAGNIPIVNFGARRTHPALAPFCDYYSYIGGFDAVSCVLGAELLGKKPLGTMPHALLVIYRFVRGDHAEGWKAFDKYMPDDVPRIMLCDTFSDEVEESIRAIESVGIDRIYGIRLDTPGSRKGNFGDILREVKWKLKQRGYSKVKVILSGGVNEHNIRELIAAGADGFGIGSAVANAPYIDFAMDIVAIQEDGKWHPICKRGKFDGRKKVWIKREEGKIIVKVTPWNEKPEGSYEMVFEKFMENGKIIRDLPNPDKIREHVLNQLSYVHI